MRVPRVLAAALATTLAAGCGAGPAGSPAQRHLAAAAAASPSVATTPSASTTPSSPQSSPAPVTSAPSSPAQPRAAIPTRILTPGAHGPAVKELQRRLAELKYYPGTADGRFGPDTLEAVWAFQEVQGLRPSDEVNRSMERALARPRAPRVLVRRGGPLTAASASPWTSPRSSTPSSPPPAPRSTSAGE